MCTRTRQTVIITTIYETRKHSRGFKIPNGLSYIFFFLMWLLLFFFFVRRNNSLCIRVKKMELVCIPQSWLIPISIIDFLRRRECKKKNNTKNLHHINVIVVKMAKRKISLLWATIAHVCGHVPFYTFSFEK